MDLYTVTDGPVDFGPGSVVSLDQQQYDLRSHRVRRIEKQGDRIVVVLDELLQFKTGTVIGIANVEARVENRVTKVPDHRPVDDGPKTKAAAAGRNQRQAEIVKAIGQLDRSDRKHFTSEGVPAVAAIEKVLGVQISAAERDRAWASIGNK